MDLLIFYIPLLFDVAILLSPFPQGIHYLDDTLVLYLTRADYIPQFMNHFILISLCIIALITFIPYKKEKTENDK